jgi:hypothetical protein
MPFSHLVRSAARSRARLAVVAIITAACAAPPPPAQPPVPEAAPAPTIMQTCPDATDGPSVIVNAIEEAHRALVANPSTPLPPACVVGAFARIDGYLPDTLVEHASSLAAAIGRRGPPQRDLLAAEVLLLGREHRFGDVSAAFDRLAAIDSQPATDVLRVAIGAAYAQHESARLTRLIAKAAARPDVSPAFRNELNVLRQSSALRSAIAEARGLVRQNPRYVAAYPSLVGNFGTLGESDSVVSYVRRALGQGASRASLQPALDPFVNTMLRRAAIYGDTWSWAQAIAAASRVDSTLSTNSTKFLVASLIVQSIDPQIGELGGLIGGTSWMPRVTGAAATDESMRSRTAACARIAPLLMSLDRAEQRLGAGGERYAGGGVSQLRAGARAERERLTYLQELCARSDPSAGGA